MKPKKRMGQWFTAQFEGKFSLETKRDCIESSDNRLDRDLSGAQFEAFSFTVKPA